MTEDAPLPKGTRARLLEVARRRRLRLTALLLSGVGKRDIARQEGISPRRLDQLLARGGIAWPGNRGSRPIAVIFVHGMHAKLLDRFAEERGLKPADIAGELLTATLERNGELARRLLRKARPA